MKKVLLTLAVLFCAFTVSAQDGWTIGGRVGAGVQAVTSYHGFGEVANKPFYLEGRFGLGFCNEGAVATADFTALVAWRVFEFGNYSAGNFFSDFGCGVNVGGKGHYCYVGPCGLARVGFKFTGAPVSLSVDWTPVFGAEIAYGGGFRASQFYSYGLANFGLTCTYNF
ncbi:MAG: hypothetical protein ACI35T_04475 [Alistipes sp.]